jgi:oxygen-independent coproporphyrinogen-3 oxidase
MNPLVRNFLFKSSNSSWKYNLEFKQYFHDELEDLKRKFLTSGFIEYTTDELKITYRGRFFLRNIAKIFDKYWRLKDYEITGP